MSAEILPAALLKRKAVVLCAAVHADTGANEPGE